MLFKNRKFKKLKGRIDDDLKEANPELKTYFLKEFDNYNSEMSGIPKGNYLDGFSEIRSKYYQNIDEFIGNFGSKSDSNFEKLKIFFGASIILKRHLHFLSNKEGSSYSDFDKHDNDFKNLIEFGILFFENLFYYVDDVESYRDEENIFNQNKFEEELPDYINEIKLLNTDFNFKDIETETILNSKFFYYLPPKLHLEVKYLQRKVFLKSIGSVDFKDVKDKYVEIDNIIESNIPILCDSLIEDKTIEELTTQFKRISKIFSSCSIFIKELGDKIVKNDKIFEFPTFVSYTLFVGELKKELPEKLYNNLKNRILKFIPEEKILINNTLNEITKIKEEFGGDESHKKIEELWRSVILKQIKDHYDDETLKECLSAIEGKKDYKIKFNVFSEGCFFTNNYSSDSDLHKKYYEGERVSIELYDEDSDGEISGEFEKILQFPMGYSKNGLIFISNLLESEWSEFDNGLTGQFEGNLNELCKYLAERDIIDFIELDDDEKYNLRIKDYHFNKEIASENKLEIFSFNEINNILSKVESESLDSFSVDIIFDKWTFFEEIHYNGIFRGFEFTLKGGTVIKWTIHKGCYMNDLNGFLRDINDKEINELRFQNLNYECDDSDEDYDYNFYDKIIWNEKTPIDIIKEVEKNYSYNDFEKLRDQVELEEEFLGIELLEKKGLINQINLEFFSKNKKRNIKWIKKEKITVDLEPRICSKCGHEGGKEDNYCIECGNKL